MNSFAQDFRYAFRNLRHNPAFTAVAIGALAIGIGANTAVFTVVESVLLRPLPYHEPSQLYTVRPMPKQPTPFQFPPPRPSSSLRPTTAGTGTAQVLAIP